MFSSVPMYGNIPAVGVINTSFLSVCPVVCQGFIYRIHHLMYTMRLENIHRAVVMEAQKRKKF